MEEEGLNFYRSLSHAKGLQVLEVEDWKLLAAIVVEMAEKLHLSVCYPVSVRTFGRKNLTWNPKFGWTREFEGGGRIYTLVDCDKRDCRGLNCDVYFVTKPSLDANEAYKNHITGIVACNTYPVFFINLEMTSHNNSSGLGRNTVI